MSNQRQSCTKLLYNTTTVFTSIAESIAIHSVPPAGAQSQAIVNVTFVVVCDLEVVVYDLELQVTTATWLANPLLNAQIPSHHKSVSSTCCY